MKIVGYYKKDGKGYVAFRYGRGVCKVTDGFHDRSITSLEGYQEVDQDEINLKRIISRMRGARPWHPLLKELRKVSAA